MQKSLLLILLGLLISCSSEKIYKKNWNEGKGTVGYSNLKNYEYNEFIKKLNPYIECNESYTDTSETRYSVANTTGEFAYQCISYQDHCDKGDGKSCYILGLKDYNAGKMDESLVLFLRSCEQNHSTGCYFLGMLTQNDSLKQQAYAKACQLGHSISCLEKKDLLGMKIDEQINFLEQYTLSENVRTSKSGLAYKIINNGNTERRPSVTSKVKVHYVGKLTNGKIFDSSYKRNSPASFNLDKVIAGWTEGLQYIGQGGKIELVIPAKLAYGARGIPPMIPPHATLYFEVELLEVN